MTLAETWYYGDPSLPDLAGLVRKRRGRVLRFRNLPPEAQKAHANYMAFDGEAWVAPDETEFSRPGLQANWDVILPLFVERYGDENVGLVTMQVADLQILILDFLRMEADDYNAYGSWEDCHREYMERSRYSVNVPTPHHGVVQAWRGQPPGTSEIWPVILDLCNNGVLQDGWHRFHQYVEQGLTEIPCLYYPDE
jgi:hypothetical protein